MALTDSIAAYDDCFQAFERAAKSKKGIRILFEDKKTANYFRPRMNYARVLQRREAVRMYERTDPRFGKSEFDKFRLKIVEAAEQTGEWWVYIDPFGMEREIMEVEELE